MEKNKNNIKNFKKWLCFCLCSFVLFAFCSITFFNISNVSASTNNFIPMSYLSNSVIYSNSRDNLGNSKTISCSLDKLYLDSNSNIYNNVVADTTNIFDDENGGYYVRVDKEYINSNIYKFNDSTLRYRLNIFDSSGVDLTLNNVVVFSFYDDVTENIQLFLNRLNFLCNNSFICSFNISYRDNLLNTYTFNYSDEISGSYDSFTAFGDYVVNNSNAFDISPFYVNYNYNNIDYEFYIIDSINIKIIPINNIYSDIDFYEAIKQIPSTQGDFYSIIDYNNIISIYNSAINDIYYNNGFNAGNTITNFSPFRVIIDTIESFLQFEPFEGFKVYYFFVIGLGGTLIMFFIKWALGG